MKYKRQDLVLSWLKAYQVLFLVSIRLHDRLQAILSQFQLIDQVFLV